MVTRKSETVKTQDKCLSALFPQSTVTPVISGETHEEGAVSGVIRGIDLIDVLECFAGAGQVYPLTTSMR